MNFLVIVILGGISLFAAVASVIYSNYKKKYKYTAWIIAQVGDNYALIQDKMRVFKTEKNHYALSFWHQRHLARSSPDYSLWTFFALGKQAEALISNDSTKYTRSQLDKILSRGCIFKMTSEGDITPAKIDENLDIKVLSQDDRAFAADAAEQTNSLLSDKWSKTAQIVTVFLTGVLIIGAVIFTVIYLNSTLSDTVANICTGAARSSNAWNVSSLPVGVPA